jgi:hypothetical protein
MKPQRQEYDQKRDEALKHLDMPTTTKACVQHIAENAKENSTIARRNNSERVTQEITTQITKKFFTRQNLKRVSLQGREGGI